MITAASANPMEILATEASANALLGRSLRSIAEHLTGRESSATLWLVEADRRTCRLHLVFEDGMVVAAPESEHVNASRTVGIDELCARRSWTGGEGFPRAEILTVDEIEVRCEGKGRYLRSLDVRAVFVLPMTIDDQLVGVFTVRIRAADPDPAPERIELARALVQQAALALEISRLAVRAEAAAVIRERETKEAALMGERSRIAGEIHDSLAHAFTGIIMQLQASKALRPEKAEVADQCVDRACALAIEAMREVRQSVAALAPEGPQVDDLPQRLRQDIERTMADTGVEGRFLMRGAPRSLPADQSLNLLRIAQEALSNAQRYAAASAISIVLGFEDDETVLRIEDDGRGFDGVQVREHGGFGLLAMQRRASRIGGRLSVSSAMGKGTVIEVRLPRGTRGAGPLALPAGARSADA